MNLSDILAKLFGSVNRIKIIRLFLLNPEEIFPIIDISRRAKVSKQASRREVALLSQIEFIKPKSEQRFVSSKKDLANSQQIKPKRQKIKGWILNSAFPLLFGLKNFILDTAPIERERLLKKIQKTGRIKLLILAGIFGQEDSSRVDIFVVGDGIRKSALERVVRDIEAEVGKELNYAAFSTQDFMYRLGMYDKFIRDILDYPHEKIIDKFGL